MEQAIRDVTAGEVQRVCAPGKWIVRREGDRTIVEIIGSKRRSQGGSIAPRPSVEQ